jgi:hypothetical protein
VHSGARGTINGAGSNEVQLHPLIGLVFLRTDRKAVTGCTDDLCNSLRLKVLSANR